ncbi:hypothetical protein P9112_000539 [Eukaryota sp. TZLM1-RC]
MSTSEPSPSPDAGFKFDECLSVPKWKLLLFERLADHSFGLNELTSFAAAAVGSRRRSSDRRSPKTKKKCTHLSEKDEVINIEDEVEASENEYAEGDNGNESDEYMPDSIEEPTKEEEEVEEEPVVEVTSRKTQKTPKSTRKESRKTPTSSRKLRREQASNSPLPAIAAPKEQLAIAKKILLEIVSSGPPSTSQSVVMAARGRTGLFEKFGSLKCFGLAREHGLKVSLLEEMVRHLVKSKKIDLGDDGKLYPIRPKSPEI